MTRVVTDDEVANHDNTLEPDPDPIVNGDDTGAAVALPMKRSEAVGDEDDGGAAEDDRKPKRDTP